MSRRTLAVIAECVALGVVLGLFLTLAVVGPVANGLGVAL